MIDRERDETLLRFKLGIDRSNDVIFITDTEGKIIYVNPSFENFYGYKESEVIGKTPRILKSGFLPDEAYREFWEKLIAKEVVLREMINKTKEGKSVTIEASANPIINSKGEIIGFLAIQRDITEKKRVEEERKNIEKMKDEFLSTVSHELRTPLASMKNITTNMLVGVTGEINEKQRRYLSMMKDDIDRLARLINDLLDMSKIESGKILIVKKSSDLIQLVSNIIEKFSQGTNEKGIHLKFTTEHPKLELEIDRDKIEQVFTNLLGNAIKFTDRGGEISIEIIKNKNEILCSVRDTGIGIPQGELGKVFDKFYQVGRIEGEGYKGTGLGLPIAKELIHLHGGKIWIESDMKKGTTFYFTLPVVK